MRRVSAWKILGAVGAVMALSFGVLYLSLRSAEARRWDEMGRLAEELIAEVPARDASRPVLRGEPVAGDAWNLYRPRIEQRTTPQETIEALRRGVRRGSARNPYGEAWLTTGAAVPQEELLEFGQVALLKAIGEAESGRSRQAAQLMLDVALYARDVGHNGCYPLQFVSTTLYDQVADELTKLLRSMGSDRETPAQIARELEILDRAMTRSGYATLNEIAREARTLKNSEAWEWWGYDLEDTPGVRYAFSRKLMAADAVSRLVAWARLHLDRDDEPDGKRENFFWEECIPPGNGLLNAAAWREDLWAADGRAHHARFHLLRLAAHFLATGETLPIVDPYGNQLLFKVEGARLKAWSKSGRQEIEVSR